MPKKRKSRKKSKTKSKSKRHMHQPVVKVSIPRNAKLVVIRKNHNPYYMDVNDTDKVTGDTSHHIWYSPDYQQSPNGGGAQ